MALSRQIRRALKRVLLGSADFHAQCTLALRDPQEEVTVRLHGLGAPRDVTRSNMMACATPFTIGVGLCRESGAAAQEGAVATLTFRRSHGDERLLGSIELHLCTVVPGGRQNLYLFEVRSSRNCCLSRWRLWGHNVYYSSKLWLQRPEVRVTTRATQAMAVFYICPRPVVLASTGDRESGNIFPMNLMGPIGGGYYAFALTTSRAATSLVERSRRVALSAIPAEEARVAFELAGNHRKDRIDWSELPFPVKDSTSFDLPVPHFALRVTEMQVESVRQMGSHTLFVARMVHEERWAEGDQFFMVHGIYNEWRRRIVQ